MMLWSRSQGGYGSSITWRQRFQLARATRTTATNSVAAWINIVRDSTPELRPGVAMR